MSGWSSDVRYALRRLAKSPGFAATTVVMLGFGIALSVTMYSVVRNVLLAGLPFPDSDQVVVVHGSNVEQGVTNGQLTPAEAERLAEPGGVFRDLGFYVWGGLTVYDGERPREFTITIVSEGFFPALGLQPVLGRWFTAEDHAEETGAMVLSYAEWQRLLGGDPNAIGRLVETSDGRMRIVGVMPPGFATPSDSVGAWRPMRPKHQFDASQPWYWNARFIYAVGRIDPALSEAQRDQRLDAAQAELRERHSMSDAGWRLRTTPALDLIIGDVRGVVWGAFGIAVLVLLIGCANVAIAIDARQIARRHEQALNQALGASRARIHRSVLIEIGMLALAAALVGVVLSLSGVEWLRELARDSLPRVDAIRLEADALLFALGLGLALPFVAAFAGALRLRAQPADAIRGGGRGVIGAGRGTRRLLPALGVALSTVSLVAAAALLLSLDDLRRVDPGYRAENIFGMQLFVDGGPDKARQVGSELRTRLAALPGVESVALTTAAPLSLIGSFSVDLKLDARDQPEPFQAGLRRVSPEYLGMLDVPLLAGRGIEASDGEGAEPVAVINRELARRVFGEASPIGEMIGLPLGQGPRVKYRVVGVMEDIRNDGLRAPPSPEILIHYDRTPWVGITLLVRTASALPGIEAQMAETLWSVAPREAITDQFTLAGDLEEQLASARFFSRVVGAFAAAALLLAALGVYAVAALQQQRRVTEFGVRLAVGARPSSLVAQILRDCLTSVAGGVALGVFGAWAALRLISSQLTDASAQGQTALWLGALLIAAAATVAALLPALRAARVDPMTSLRHE